MSWRVTLAVEFDPEFQQLPMAVQLDLLAHAEMLNSWVRTPAALMRTR